MHNNDDAFVSNGLKLFEECLQNPEPLIDEFYCNNKLIINRSPLDPPTEIMQTNKLIIERITACKVALLDNDTESFERHIVALAKLLDKRYVNFTEFTSFWPALDVSVSLYLNLTSKEQLDFLKTAVMMYLKDRHDIYSAHGYSATSIQVRKDFEKHKTGGSAANRKFKFILEDSGYKPFSSGEFLECRKRFVFLDDFLLSAKVLLEMRNKLNLKFDWSQKNQNKSADLAFVTKTGQIFICEFKHMKEGGGGQNKQVSEMIAFIEQRESSERVSYLALLDGIYFNSLLNSVSPKATEQLLQVKDALKKISTNYFVNTYGFKQILKM